MKMTTAFYVTLGVLLPSLAVNYTLRARLAAAHAASSEAQAEAARATLEARIERSRAEMAALSNTVKVPTFAVPELPGVEQDPATPGCAVSEVNSAPCCSTLELGPKQIEAMSMKCATACELATTSSAEAEQVVKDLETCLAAKVVDRERIHTLLDRLFVLRRQELESKIDAILTVRDTLTAEQIEKLKAMVRGKE